MSYQKYQTEAIVLRGNNVGEADRLLVLYTEAFGLVNARASAIRRENSKMRYSLQSYDRANVSLVRGNRGWRAAGASSIARIVTTNADGIAAFARIASLVERLVIGEEKNTYLFGTLADAHQAFIDHSHEHYALIELMCVARVLYSLGYVSAESSEAPIFTHTTYAPGDLEEVQKARERILASVNQAIAETHL